MIVRMCTKTTIWDQRYFEIPDDTPADKILEATENAEGYEQDFLPGTAIDLTPEDNECYSTIKIYNDQNKVIYKNGI